jgi:hypothetical protein
VRPVDPSGPLTGQIVNRIETAGDFPSVFSTVFCGNVEEGVEGSVLVRQ